MKYSTQLTFLSLLIHSPISALARTDLSGCTSFTSMVTVNPTAHGYGNVYPSVMYYVPDTLEICTIPDCGGGRAPPKTGVPGCPLYSGTATPTPSFLTADPLAPAATSTVAPAASSVAPGTSSLAPEATSVAAEPLSVAAAETTSATEAAHTLMSGSDTATAATVTTSLVLVNTNATGTSGRSAQATGAGPTGIKGNTTGNGTGPAKGAPSGSMETTSYGDVLRVTVGLFSAAIALAAAFVL